MNAAAILSIPETEPERLFTDPAKVGAEHLALRKRWHPDAGGDAKVFAHIEALRRAAEQKAHKGLWQPPGMLDITDRYGKRVQIKYRARRPFELGEMFIGMGLVTYIIPRAHEALVLNGLQQIGKMRYPTETFRKSLEPHLPKVERAFETATDWVICIRKRPDEVLLADLIAYLGGRIDPKHTAWIISSLLNLTCFLDVSDMTLNSMSVSTVFVSPQKHSVSLYGGWWYAAGAGKLLTHLPPETAPLASSRLRAHKVASSDLDLQSIKAIGRACLGDPTGGGLRGRADVPSPFTQFLQLPAAKSAFAEYERWPKVLEDSFGPRRYHELKITGEDVYPEGTQHGKHTV
jgi:hypothetical protein